MCGCDIQGFPYLLHLCILQEHNLLNSSYIWYVFSKWTFTLFRSLFYAIESPPRTADPGHGNDGEQSPGGGRRWRDCTGCCGCPRLRAGFLGEKIENTRETLVGQERPGGKSREKGANGKPEPKPLWRDVRLLWCRPQKWRTAIWLRRWEHVHFRAEMTRGREDISSCNLILWRWSMLEVLISTCHQ